MARVRADARFYYKFILLITGKAVSRAVEPS